MTPSSAARSAAIGAQRGPSPAYAPSPWRRGPAPDIVDRVADALAVARSVRDGGAYVELLEEAAFAAAARGRRPAGPLDRSVFAAKDVIAVAGLPLRAGSAARQRAPAETLDAPIVTAVKAAGGVLLGTTACHELAFGVTGVNDHVGTPHHPLDRGLIPGGSSSGGAVAVAEGSADFAIGTDTGGSIRIPGALCGVVGYKPGRGGWPQGGVLPLAPTLDHLGVHARAVAEAVRLHAALGGRHPDRPPTLRVGVAERELEAADPGVAAAVDAAIKRLESRGCRLTPVRWPGGEEVLDASSTIMFAEAAFEHRGLLHQRPGLLGEDVRARLRRGAQTAATAYLDAHGQRAVLIRQTAAILAEVDVVAGPTVPILAPRRDRAAGDAVRLVANTRLANLLGVPAISIPVSGAALPVGLHLTAATEAGVLAAGELVEDALARAPDETTTPLRRARG